MKRSIAWLALAFCAGPLLGQETAPNVPPPAGTPAGTEIVRGTYSYTYGDRESLVQARETCKSLAVQDAIESYYLFVESSSRVENGALEQDIVKSLASGCLRNLRIADSREEGRTVTLTVEAEVDPAEVRALVAKRIAEADTDTASAAPAGSARPAPAEGSGSPRDFSALLSKAENRIAAAERGTGVQDARAFLAQLEALQADLDAFPEGRNPFEASMLRSAGLRTRVVIDLLRLENSGDVGRRSGDRVVKLRLRKNLREFEASIESLNGLNGLTEKQRALGAAWTAQGRQLEARVRRELR